jgi:hypothetical protein
MNTTSPSIIGGGSASFLRENAAAIVGSGARGGAARGIEEPLNPSGFEGHGGWWENAGGFPVPRCSSKNGIPLLEERIPDTSVGGLIT